MNVRAPLCEKPFVSIEAIEQEREANGLWKQKLYRDGFPHANCGGACVKQGISGWTLLYRTNPERFRDREAKEVAMQQYLGKPVTMLEETRKGVRRPLPLSVLRERIEAGDVMPLYDFGGCNCFAGSD